jgi:glutamate synthase domain-containing protein 3
VAASVLDRFDALLPAFVKVFPRDYKRALAELSEADGRGDEGIDVVLPPAPAPAR